jgi:hypothetical protein
MHEAIQKLTKTVATHLPPSTPTLEAAPRGNDIAKLSPESSSILNIEESFIETPLVETPAAQESETDGVIVESLPAETAVEVPISPEIPSEQPTTTEPAPTEAPVEASAAAPKRATHKKRTSVWNILWPFGGYSTPKEEPAPTPSETESSVTPESEAGKDAKAASTSEGATSTVAAA